MLSVIIIIITDLYSAFRSEDTEALERLGCIPLAMADRDT